MTPETAVFARVSVPFAPAFVDFPGRSFFQWAPASFFLSCFLVALILAIAFYAWKALQPDAAASKLDRSVTYWIAIATAYFSHVAYLDAIVEDAYIPLRYVRHALRGSGLAWNPGEPPLEGFSNLLFTLLTLLCAKLGVPEADAARAMSLLAGAGCLVVLAKLGRELTKDARVAALLPLLAVGQPTFAAYCGSGLETSTFGCFVLTALLAFYRERWLLSSLLCAAAWATRPDGVVLALTLGALALGRSVSTRRTRSFLEMAVPFALVVIGVSLFRLHYFGDLVPNSARAKAVGGWSAFHFGTEYLGAFARSTFDFVDSAVLLVATLALALLARRSPSIPGLASLTIFSALFFVSVAVVGGDWMPGFRYLFPVLLVGIVINGALVGKALSLSPRPRLAMVVLLVLLLPLVGLRVSRSPSLRESFRAMEASMNDLSLYTKWLEARGIGRYRMAAFAVGIKGYLYPGAILDVCGLNDRQIAHAPGREFQFPGHSRCDWALAVKRHPPILSLLTGELNPEPVLLPDFRQDGYLPIVIHFERAAKSGYATLWARSDVAGEIARKLSNSNFAAPGEAREAVPKRSAGTSSLEARG